MHFARRFVRTHHGLPEVAVWVVDLDRRPSHSSLRKWCIPSTPPWGGVVFQQHSRFHDSAPSVGTRTGQISATIALSRQSESWLAKGGGAWPRRPGSGRWHGRYAVAGAGRNL